MFLLVAFSWNQSKQSASVFTSRGSTLWAWGWERSLSIISMDCTANWLKRKFKRRYCLNAKSFYTINKPLYRSSLGKNNFWTSKRDRQWRNYDKENTLVSLINSKRISKSWNTTTSSTIEINSKPKKIMFTGSTTIISWNNKINFKISTKTGPWSKIPTSKCIGNNNKKNSTRLFRWEWQDKMRINCERFRTKENLWKVSCKLKYSKMLERRLKVDNKSIDFKVSINLFRCRKMTMKTSRGRQENKSKEDMIMNYQPR